VQVIAHGDLRRRHIRPDLNLGFARHCIDAVGIKRILRLHDRTRAADRGAVDDSCSKRIKGAESGLVDGLFGGGQAELGEQIGPLLDPSIHPVGRVKTFGNRLPGISARNFIGPWGALDRRLPA